MINKLILKIFCLFFISLTCLSIGEAATNNLVYIFTLVKDEGQINYNNFKLGEGDAPDMTIQPKDGYTLHVISFNQTVLYSFKFELETQRAYVPPPEIFDEEGNQIAVADKYLEEKIATQVMIVPYFANAKKIEIFDPDKKLILSIDVSKYSTKKVKEETKTMKNQTLLFDIILIFLGLLFVVIVIITIAMSTSVKKEKPPVQETKREHKKNEKPQEEIKFCSHCRKKFRSYELFCSRCGKKK